MRKIDPTRACLHVEMWPPADQTLWNEVVCSDDFERETERPKWRPTSVQANREGYGRFINYLMHSGADLEAAPADRVTPKSVRGYLKVLEEQGLGLQTRANRMLQLLAVIRVFAPERDWEWLKRRYNRLALMANDQRRPRPVTILSGDILARALKALNEVQRKGLAPEYIAAIEYRNWLMVAALTLMPLRRDNFSDLSIKRHLRRNQSEWRIEIPGSAAKGKKAITMPVPPVLHPHFELYFEQVRPRLLASRTSDRFWITNLHTPMTSHSVYITITNFTRHVFGEAINPHRFRHIGATSTVLAEPENMEAARAFLAHADTKMTEDRYVIAHSVAASRKHAQLIAELRRRFTVRSPSSTG